MMIDLGVSVRFFGRKCLLGINVKSASGQARGIAYRLLAFKSRPGNAMTFPAVAF
jgi:hypothetical protein